ncbi:MAG: lactate utilization protein [Bacteroidales bacterium]|nr:lactate utilization protein [Bacteroidales bacterium]
MKDRKGFDQGTTNKEQILAKIRNAVMEKPEAMFKDIDLQSDTWNPIKEEDGNAITFVQRFKDMGGIFIYLESEAELGDCLRQLAPQNDWEPLWCTSPKLQPLLEQYGLSYCTSPDTAERKKVVSLLPCDFLIAQTGSIILTDGTAGARLPYILCDVLLVVAHTDQIVGGLKEALHRLGERHGTTSSTQAVVLTGLTQSYAIEQETVNGVFGARQIAVFLVDD